MSQQNASLIGFLKKKSLFASSPQKSVKNKEKANIIKKATESQKSFKNNP